MTPFERIGRALLFRLDPETAHTLSIKALKSGFPAMHSIEADQRLAVRLCGLDFPNPIGMAAGYDKNGEAPDALLELGFGFVEIGSVTPLAQAGNPKPRIFRLSTDAAVINRLGFNNEGHDRCMQRLAARKQRSGIVGVNIGANKDSADRIGDYVLGVTRFAPLSSYLTVNISSPNTPGLRALQERGELSALLGRVIEARDRVDATARRKTPIFLKIAPDLSEDALRDVSAEILAKGADGVIVSNTTLSRAGLRPQTHFAETGGLSGKPLFERSTIVLAKMRKLLGRDIAIIGVGGVDSAETAMAKIRAGADLVQLYTGMIYHGPYLAARIVADMSRMLTAEGATNLTALRDTHVDCWADRKL